MRASADGGVARLLVVAPVFCTDLASDPANPVGTDHRRAGTPDARAAAPRSARLHLHDRVRRTGRLDEKRRRIAERRAERDERDDEPVDPQPGADLDLVVRDRRQRQDPAAPRPRAGSGRRAAGKRAAAGRATASRAPARRRRATAGPSSPFIQSRTNGSATSHMLTSGSSVSATPSTMTIVFCSSNRCGWTAMSKLRVIANSPSRRLAIEISRAASPRIGSPTARSAVANSPTS